MLLRRRNTTSLTKFHPLTLHTSPNFSELTKHLTCEATIVKKIHIQKSKKKKQAWFLLNPFCNARGCVYWWKWNLFCNKGCDVLVGFQSFLKYMGCGGIWILLVIYSAKDTIYTLFVFCFSSVMGKRRGLMNPRHHCYGQETRTNEPTSPLLRARDED
jgi:hypothetical protein